MTNPLGSEVLDRNPRHRKVPDFPCSPPIARHVFQKPAKPRSHHPIAFVYPF